MQERIFNCVTSEYELHGIICEPAQVNPALPCVVIPNSGLVHHVGTCRSGVELARSLASAGFLSVRIDLSQLGDSSGRLEQTHLTHEQRSVQELQSVLDQLEQQYQQHSFVVYGLCSGSQNGFRLAVADARVIGLFGVDHFGFQNWSYRLVHYCRQIFRLRPWLNKVQKLLGSRLPQTAHNDEVVDLGDGGFEWKYPAKEEVEAGYRQLIDRNVKMEFIYTGDWSGEYNHRSQFFRMHAGVDFKGLVQIHYKPEMSHILAEPASRQYVTQRVLEFLKNLNTVSLRTL